MPISGHLEAIKVRRRFRYCLGEISTVRLSANQIELYFTLCHTPILIDGAKLSFALDKETGKKCFTLPAWELNIAWKNGPQHWQW
ncbi:unnamed protein product [Camellia sinensis]